MGNLPEIKNLVCCILYYIYLHYLYLYYIVSLQITISLTYTFDSFNVKFAK